MIARVPHGAAPERAVERPMTIAPDLAGDDFLRRPPRRRPERGEAPGRLDDEIAVGGSPAADGEHGRADPAYFFWPGGGLSLL